MARVAQARPAERPATVDPSLPVVPRTAGEPSPREAIRGRAVPPEPALAGPVARVLPRAEARRAVVAQVAAQLAVQAAGIAPVLLPADKVVREARVV